MSDTSTPKKRKTVRLTESQWSEAAALWELGEVTLADLSERYGCTINSISRKLKKIGAKRGSKAQEHRREVIKTVQKSALTDSEITGQRIRDTKEEAYTWAVMLQKAALSEIANALQNKTNLAIKTPALKAIEKAIAIVETGTKIRRTALDMDKEDVDPMNMPDLVIRELTQDQILRLQKGGFEAIVDDDLQGLEMLGTVYDEQSMEPVEE